MMLLLLSLIDYVVAHVIDRICYQLRGSVLCPLYVFTNTIRVYISVLATLQAASHKYY